MLMCYDCGAVFEYPKLIYERHGQDDPPFEPIYMCPACKGMDVCDAVQCDCCCEYTCATYVETQDGLCYCDNCYQIHRGE